MSERAPANWKLDHIDEKENMVILVSDDVPVIKKFGAPQAIVHAQVLGDHVQMTCVDGTVWDVRITDGSRRRLMT